MTTSSAVNGAAVTDDFEFAALREARNYRAALVREFSPVLHGRVIEVGSGVGQMTAEFARVPKISEIVAVEPDSRFHAGFVAANPQLRLIRGTAADIPERTGWDALVAVNVLEHIEHDASELAAWATLLRERRGRLGLFVPARPEIYAPIDRDFGHYRRYTKPDLRSKLEKAGFEIERLCYFNVAGYFAWWLNFRVRGQRKFEVAAVRAFDRFVFPVVHGLEVGVCRPPFGQSLLAIARAR